MVNIRPARGLQATGLFNSETSCSSRCEKVCSPCPKSAICLLMSLTCLTLRCGMALPTERSVIQMGFTGTGFDLALADCKDCEHGCHKLPRSTPKFKAVITPTFHHGTASFIRLSGLYTSLSAVMHFAHGSSPHASLLRPCRCQKGLLILHARPKQRHCRSVVFADASAADRLAEVC